MDNQFSYFFRLSAVLEAMPDALVIIDAKGRIVLINKQTEKLFGYERTDLLGELVERLMPERFRGRHVHHRTDFIAAPRTRSMGEGFALFGLKKDGAEFPIEISLSPLKTDEGLLVLAAVRDISVQKKLESQILEQNRALTESTTFLNSILESATENSIIAKDLKGNIVIWNEGARRNYGYTAEEMVGKSSSILHTEEDNKSGRVKALLDTALKIGKAEGTFERVRKNGEHFTASVSVTLRKATDGTPLGYVLISKDITEQKRLESQLHVKNEELEMQNRRVQEASRLKSEFLANMSHELRTPLNGIIGFAELMYNGKVGPVSADHKEYLGDILLSSRHLLQLINDVLDLAKVESGKMEFHPETVNLEKIITEVRDILRTLISKKQIKMDVSVDPKINEVIIDPAKLKQVLYNYISNAIKFTPDGGEVHICVLAEGKNNFRLEIRDTGIGIRDEDLKKLFVEFQQLDATISKKYQGTGLGLALTKRIVEAQGGSVGVKSVVEKGSTFFAILPRKSAAHESDEKIIKEQIVSVPTPGMQTILVIEDEEKDRELIVNTLKKAGYAVVTAASGAEALRLAEKRQFDAVTLDLILPDMSGWDVLRDLRAGKFNRDIPVIVVTVIAEKSASMGFAIQDFLVKPVVPNRLLAALEEVWHDR